MCGRFALGLPPRDYVDTVEEQVNRPRRKRKRADDGGASGSRSADGPSSSAKTRSGNRVQQRRETQEEHIDGADSRDDDYDESDAVVGPLSLNAQIGENDYYPTYNVAPAVQVPVLRAETSRPMKGYADDKASAEASSRAPQSVLIQTMRWGLLPHYTKSIPRGADALRTINARDDAVLSGQSMWTPLLRKGKRCVVFCQGFYEWLKKDDQQRIAHFVGMKDEGSARKDMNGNGRALMAMAGLWERCFLDDETSSDNQRETLSFTIITTESNRQLNFLHDRMPVILPDSRAIQIWLGLDADASNEDICRLLKPYDRGELDCYTVPKEVGRVGNNEKKFILPVASRKDGIAAAFGRQQQKQQSSPRSEQKKEAKAETNAPMLEEMKAVDASEREQERKRRAEVKKQEESDAELARKLQREQETQEGSSIRGGKNEQDEQEQEYQNPKPSSRFSPEPYNPPVSPDRPRGGYSTAENPDPAPYKRSSDRKQSASPGQKTRTGGGGLGAANTVKQRQLHESAKGTMDIRSFMKK